MKKHIWAVFIIFLLIAALMIGKHWGSRETAAYTPEIFKQTDNAELNLVISVVSSIDAEPVHISLEQGNYREISYWGVESVTIDIGGSDMDLGDALREGLITVDEIIALARKDASLGLCREAARTENGLTEFTFYYGSYRLHYVYDIYETPDGEKHLITDFAIYGVGTDDVLFKPTNDAGAFIDLEDWGLTFDVTAADRSGITINCTQAGGQQFGNLCAGHHFLYRKETDTLSLVQVDPLNEAEIPPLFTSREAWEPENNNFLTMGGTTELSYDLAKLYGELAPGEYIFVLQLVDCYDKEDIPSLARNFYDAQSYEIEFVIE